MSHGGQNLVLSILMGTLIASKSRVLALVDLKLVRQPLQILQISRQSVVGGTSEVELFGGAGILGELGIDVVQLVLETTKEPVRLLATGCFFPPKQLAAAIVREEKPAQINRSGSRCSRLEGNKLQCSCTLMLQV